MSQTIPFAYPFCISTSACLTNSTYKEWKAFEVATSNSSMKSSLPVREADLQSKLFSLNGNNNIPPTPERNHADEWNNVCTGFDIPQNILITRCLLFEMFRFYFNRIKSQCRIKCELLVMLLHGGTGCIDATRQFKSWVLTTLLMSQVGLKDRQGWGTCSWHLFLCLENEWATTWTRRSIVQKILQYSACWSH